MEKNIPLVEDLRIELSIISIDLRKISLELYRRTMPKMADKLLRYSEILEEYKDKLK